MARSTRATPAMPTQIAAMIEDRDIAAEGAESYRLYAMMTIGERAIPDARDGLKPVQRRILQAMLDQGLRNDRPRQKCATIVGATLGRYHPHGDSAVYETMVRMGQPWVMAEPLIDPQGNFGSQDGDPPAAYRYTEARMTASAAAMLADLDLDVVDRVPTYDDRAMEAVVLPGRLPNLLLNGVKGIAVGLSTSIPPHNLGELGAAITLLCENPKVDDEALLALVLGPDFPTGGEMLVDEGLRQAYLTGNGRVRVRAKVHREELPDGRVALVVTEMPYGIDKGPAVDKLAGVVRAARAATDPRQAWADTIAAIRDESAEAVRVVIELKRGARPEAVLEGLWNAPGTEFATTVSMQMLALVEGRPRQLTLRGALEVFVAHRLVVIRRRAMAHLATAAARAHIVAGLQAALLDLDRVVALVREAASPAAARTALMKQLQVDAVQADAILALRLSQLTRLDAHALATEAKALAADTARLQKLLASERAMRGVVRDEIQEDMTRFGRPRRTQRVDGVVGAPVTLAALAQTITVDPRGTVAPSGGAVTAPARQIAAGPDVPVWIFTSHGRVGRAGADGLDALADGERMLTAWAGPLPNEGEIIAWYRNGLVKRMPVVALADRPGWSSLATLAEGDELVAVDVATSDEGYAWAASASGKGILTPIAALPSYGRQSRGVAGMRIGDGDHVAAAGIAPVDGALTVRVLAGTPMGGKAFPLADWPVQGRGGQGVQLLATGEPAPLHLVVIGEDAQSLRTVEGWTNAEVPTLNVATRSRRLQRLDARGILSPGLLWRGSWV